MRIRVLADSAVRSVPDKKGTNQFKDWVFTEIQCLVETPDGPIACSTTLPDGHPPVKAGDYDCAITPGRDRNGKLAFRVSALRPASVVPAPKAA